MWNLVGSGSLLHVVTQKPRLSKNSLFLMSSSQGHPECQCLEEWWWKGGNVEDEIRGFGGSSPGMLITSIHIHGPGHSHRLHQVWENRVLGWAAMNQQHLHTMEGEAQSGDHLYLQDGSHAHAQENTEIYLVVLGSG